MQEVDRSNLGELRKDDASHRILNIKIKIIISEKAL